MSQLSSEHMSHAGVYEQLKRCQVVENGMVRTWLSRWSVAARFPGMCRTIDEFRWCAQHMAHCLLPPAETKMVRRLKFNLRSLGQGQSQGGGERAAVPEGRAPAVREGVQAPGPSEVPGCLSSVGFSLFLMLQFP